MFQVGFFLLFLNLFYLMEKCEEQIYQSSTMNVAKVKGKDSPLLRPRLILMEAVNNYSLLFFLTGNVLTGIINLSINTLEVTPGMSLLIILSYVLILTTFTLIIYRWRKRSKFQVRDKQKPNNINKNEGKTRKKT